MRIRPCLVAAVALLALAGHGTAQPRAPLAECIAALRSDPARAEQGVRTDAFDRLTAGVQDLRPMIEQQSQAQPEFVLPLWDYLARLVDDERVADARAVLAREAEALRRIARRHAVDAQTLVAVFGVETDFGRVAGRWPVIDATLSRACLAPDSAERKRQFYAALWLAQEGRVPAADFRGSWAGAFGMTQFMPHTFRSYMDGPDGARAVDIFASVPDALATTANYLRALGWREGLPWGVHVTPSEALAGARIDDAGHACLAAAAPRGRCRSVADWRAAGLAGLESLPGDAVAALLMPAGPQGPAWLVTGNYRALWGYNRADAYALAIGLLSDRLRGAPAPALDWPTDDPGLSRAELREVQGLLRGRGACDVVADGRAGPRTAAAVAAFERAHDLPETGRAGARLLAHLRAQAAPAEPACGAASAPR